MYIRVCTYVHVHIYSYIWYVDHSYIDSIMICASFMHRNTYIYIHIYIYIYLYVYVHTCMYIYIHTYGIWIIHILTRQKYVHHSYTDICTYTHIYIYTYIRIHIYIYTCIYIRVSTYVYVHVYTYIWYMDHPYIDSTMIRAGKMNVPTSILKQIWICTKSLLICTQDLCLYGAPWHRTHSNWIQIYLTTIKTTFRALYLWDSPERNQICWDFFSYGVNHSYIDSRMSNMHKIP